MKKLFIISMLIGAMPLAMLAQDDDLYFVPKKASKTSKVEKVTDDYGLPKDTYYSGSDRTVDDYNRRVKSFYEFVDGDSSKVDIVQIDSVRGVYPDSLESEDFALTKKMSRFEDYDLSERAAYWAGYERGRYDWGWHSPWYYRAYGWYDPWYYRSWYGWYDPWYYSSWYYGNWYGWGSPYYWSWNYPYYWDWGYPYYYGGGGGGRHYYGHTGNAGTINMNGSSHYTNRVNRGPIAGNAQRNASLRDRASRMGGGRTYSSGNSDSSRSGNFSGYRGSSSSNSSRGSYNSGSRSSSSYSGGSRSGGSYSSGGGGFSGGGSRSSGGGGGGGSRMGGRR